MWCDVRERHLFVGDAATRKPRTRHAEKWRHGLSFARKASALHDHSPAPHDHSPAWWGKAVSQSTRVAWTSQKGASTRPPSSQGSIARNRSSNFSASSAMSGLRAAIIWMDSALMLTW